MCVNQYERSIASGAVLAQNRSMNERNANVIFFGALALVLLSFAFAGVVPPNARVATVGVFIASFAVGLAACKKLGHIASVPRPDGSQVCLQCYGPLQGSHDPGDFVPVEQPEPQDTEDELERARR
jgi:hypothetical protein